MTSIIAIAATILIDSHFWDFWLWPEFQVFKLNTIENKSSEWGVSPWYWYFAMAIPKSVTIAYPLAMFAIFYKPKRSFIDWGVVELLAPAVIFVGLYSLLPHKELRFIFPALTIFNLAGAIGITKIFKKLSKSQTINLILFVGLLAALCVSAAYSSFLTYISFHNYPGGQAMREFNSEFLYLQQNHNSVKLSQPPNIHIDVYPAMTGVTRFLYENQNIGWRYNRTEYLTDSEKQVFTHLFTDSKRVEGFRLHKPIESYSRVNLKKMEVVFAKSMYILEREDIYHERISYRSPTGTKCADK